MCNRIFYISRVIVPGSPAILSAEADPERRIAPLRGGKNVSEHHDSIYENTQYPPRERREHREEHSRRPRKRRGSRAGLVLKVLGTLLLVALVTGAFLCCFGAVYIKTVILPVAQSFNMNDFDVGENSVMYYQDKSTGEYKELTTLLNTTSSVWVEWDDIPKYLKDAAVAVEDKRFYTHPGVDWMRTGKAVLCMFTGQDIQGGSTITQQLIKNLTGYNETTVKRKVIEIFRALEFTKKYSKDYTLEWYLNIIPMGGKYKGVGSASYAYFGKPVNELSLAECASLISITNNPSMYSPYSTARFEDPDTGEILTARDKNKERQELVLWLMKDQGKISQEEYDQAVAEELVFVRSESETQETDIYSWYEEQVITDVKNDLMDKYDYSEEMAARMLARGGLRIYTCVDLDVQKAAEKVYENRDNLNYTSSNGQLMQSAITIIDNSTGDIAAIVGRVGEKTGNRWKNFATEAYRQPGSSIKPLSVYSPGLEMGVITPITIMDDYPYQLMNGSPWPINSGSAKYRGLTTVRSGLARSVNTIALRVLADRVTVDASFNFVESRYHIDLVQAQQSGDTVQSDMSLAPLSMGGLTKGVTTRQMATAFAVFPSGGIYRNSRTYTKVTHMVNGVEEVLIENPSVQEQAVKPTTAYYMNSMLSGVVSAEGTAGSARFSSAIDIAGKTGTTSSSYDRWFVGYTPYYTAAVWTGYEYNARMSGTNRAIGMWKLVMEQVHQGLSAKKFSQPDGLTTVTVCKDSGLLATSYCEMDPRGSRAFTDRVFRDDAPTEFCTCHTQESVVTMCKASPILAADGSETGLWHLAGEYCPEDQLVQFSLVQYDRTPVGNAVAGDNAYLYSTIEAEGSCTVHTTAPIPDPEVPVSPEQPEQPGTPDQSGQPDSTPSQDVLQNRLP